MPKNDTGGSSITRRVFMKGAAFAAGTAAVGLGGAAGYDTWLKPAQAHAQSDEHLAYTYHQLHCGGACPMACKVRDGRLVQVQPNEAGGDRYATICLKGLSEVQHIYGKGRIQTPLKRVGERGSSDFVAISWDEALDLMVDTITDLQKQHGKDCVLVKQSTESLAQFMAPLFGAQTGGNGGIDNGTGNGLDPAIGHGGGYAYATGEARDWTNANMVLMVGSNFLESTLPQVRLFFEAKEAGAKMVTVDPHFSTTAGKSDQWIPIVPGTDAALFLGMVTAIIDNKWYDENFVLQHTALPYLVDAKTKKLVRDHAEDPNAEEPETGEKNPFFVWDQSSSQKRAYTDAAAKPTLKGTFTVDGASCTTAFSLLETAQKHYTLEWASEKTGIPADTIKTLAQEYACNGPASLAVGWGGSDKMANADIGGHAAALLAALTGNIGKPGAHVGVFVGGAWNGYSASLGAWELPAQLAAATSKVASYDLKYQDNNVRAFICLGDAINQKYGNQNKTIEWVKKLDFIVTIDAYFTEGAKWSDLVLPTTSRFENDEEIGGIASGYNHLVLQAKVIDPLFEAKTEFWIEREIAKRLGVDQYLPKTARELVEAKLANSEDPYLAALTVDDIVKNGYLYPLKGIEKPRTAYEDGAFLTTSGRMDVYYDNLVEFGQELPAYEDCNEAYADNPLRAQYPLQLANVRTRFRIHNQFWDARWTQQFYEPYVELNPTDMQARGLAAGDTVEVLNDRGSFKCKVKGNEAVRPDSARMYEAATSDYLVEGNLQNVTNDTMIERGYALMTGPVIPFSDTLVEIKKA
ncbi:molybdopterin-dependent oxidoreductase [Gordonibacter sp.]|uniref:molybdopterin-dependent oxidoreductase n=1 Tax=Gordonibacter sp. TaxID=1968902 RepID=UPI002FCC6D37